MCTIVSFLDPALKEGKGLVYIERFLGRTGCSISYDWHDNASFWHGNISTPLTRVQYTTIGRCHMIITCKLHGVNLIGATEFWTETSSSPRKHSMYTRPFPSLRVGSGNTTKAYGDKSDDTAFLSEHVIISYLLWVQQYISTTFIILHTILWLASYMFYSIGS